MRCRNVALGLVLLLAVVGACQQPADTASPPVSAAPLPGESPDAPAIEPEPTGPDESIRPPASPVAPAIEPEPTGPDPTVEFNPG